MTDDSSPPNPTLATPCDAALLERALQQALPPPELPAGFRSQLLARVQSEPLADLQARRLELDREYERQRQQLRADYVSLRRDRLALIVASAFAAGVCMSLLLPWFYRLLGSESAVSVALAAAALALALGTSIWLERLGKPGSMDLGVH